MTDDARPAATSSDATDATPGPVPAADAAPPEPDTKDWTWVLARPCPDCGFVAADVDPAGVADAVRATVPRWRAALERPAAALRPAPDVWSPLEYGAHVRDVHRVFLGRLTAMLATDDPLFDNWDQDAAALADGYGRQDPRVVADELAEAAAAYARAFDGVGPDDLDRPGRRSNGSVFTVRTLARYHLHDVVHHLHDVRA